jgi:hypothetical protein
MPSRRLEWAWRAWCLLLLIPLWWTDMPLLARLATWAVVYAVYRAGSRCLALTDRLAVRRLHWGSDGRWRLQDAALRLHYVWLAAPALVAGPLLWLRLRDANRCFTVLIDARYAEPVALRTLKGRLRLNPHRQESRH